jgi:hypothetical protein
VAELYEDWVRDLKVEFSDSICLPFFVGFHSYSYLVVFRIVVDSTFWTEVKLFNERYSTIYSQDLLSINNHAYPTPPNPYRAICRVPVSKTLSRVSKCRLRPTKVCDSSENGMTRLWAGLASEFASCLTGVDLLFYSL